ncbi:MAG TPA: hypothetical protein VEH08_01605 [Methanomassiliicoccales archaeon]|nr:hypothetical protein [Methanomassiliicoccales archaeon]
MRGCSVDEFFPSRFPSKLEKAKTIADVYEVVKDAVHACEGWSRAGLMLGLAELGSDADSVVGGLHPLGSNIIILNKMPMRRVKEARPELLKPYLFHVLLHEYLHTIGIVEEELTQERVKEISLRLFGPEHLVTKLAEDITQFLPFIRYPFELPLPEGTEIELVEDFDRSSADYFA